MLQKLKLKNFTAFDDLAMEFVPGINVIIGENSTGKTHLMKAAYAILHPNSDDSDKEHIKLISTKLVEIFALRSSGLGELARRPVGEDTSIELDIHDYEGESKFAATLNHRSRKYFSSSSTPEFKTFSRRPSFIPTKEVISFIHYMVSNYDLQESGLDGTYLDLCEDLDLEPLNEADLDERAKWALDELSELCKGIFLYDEGTISFKQKNNEVLANSLIAEGYRKLGVLYRLIENGSISPSVSGPLFWDEPEANLNPRLLNLVVRVLLELARLGQQVILSSHNYVFLKELELERRESDVIRYHVLYHDENGIIKNEYAADYTQLNQNAIAETFSSLYDRDVKKTLERMKL